VIRNRVQSYKYMYLWLWLILYRSYDAPTGYLPAKQCSPILPSNLRSLPPSLPLPLVSGACTSSPCATARCCIVAISGQSVKGRPQERRRVSAVSPSNPASSTSQLRADSSTLILQAAAIHLDKVTCSPLPARSGTASTSSCCPGLPCASVHASDMYAVCQQRRVTAQKHARPTPVQTCPRLSNQSRGCLRRFCRRTDAAPRQLVEKCVCVCVCV
jgi:hypothetical protein